MTALECGGRDASRQLHLDLVHFFVSGRTVGRSENLIGGREGGVVIQRLLKGDVLLLKSCFSSLVIFP